VLAIDQSADQRGKDDGDHEDKGKPKATGPGATLPGATVSGATVLGKTATLEVDAQQAEMLAAGQAAGSLTLSLRSSSDNAETQTIAPPTVRVMRGGKAEPASLR
jgi:Flp pilus assembly protein CpaB